MDKGAVTGVVKGMDKKFMRKLAIWAVVLVVGVTVGKLYRTTVEQSLGMLDRVKLLWPDVELLSNVVYGVGQAAFLSDSSSTWTPSLNFTLFTTNVSSTNPLSRFHFFCAASSSL